MAIAQLDCSMERKKSKPASSLNHCEYVAGGVEIITWSAIAGALSRRTSVAESVVDWQPQALFTEFTTSIAYIPSTYRILDTSVPVCNCTLLGMASTMAVITLSRPPVNWRNMPDWAAVPFRLAISACALVAFASWLSNWRSVIVPLPARGTSPSATAPLAALVTPALEWPILAAIMPFTIFPYFCSTWIKWGNVDNKLIL